MALMTVSPGSAHAVIRGGEIIVHEIGAGGDHHVGTRAHDTI
jgi:hypothetical protein